MLIDDIRAIAKDGADLTTIEGQIEKMNPISGLQTKEEAWELIKSNPFMLSAFDSEQSKRAEKVIENFRNGKMQEEIKQRELEVRKEFNPEETDEQRELREIREQMKQMSQEKQMSILQDELSNKAKDMGFDPLMAREFAAYGDKAMNQLERFAEWQNKVIEDRLSTELKGKFTQTTPKTSSKPTSPTMTRQEFNGMSAYEQRAFVTEQKGSVVDE
jgi:hypothetical protein